MRQFNNSWSYLRSRNWMIFLFLRSLPPKHSSYLGAAHQQSQFCHKHTNKTQCLWIWKKNFNYPHPPPTCTVEHFLPVLVSSATIKSLGIHHERDITMCGWEGWEKDRLEMWRLTVGLSLCCCCLCLIHGSFLGFIIIPWRRTEGWRRRVSRTRNRIS